MASRSITRSVALGAAVLTFALVSLAIVLLSPGAEAHNKNITSKYTYNEDVYPILRERCGSCHVTGGAAPMSLLTYVETIPWAASMHEELAHSRMPPWYADTTSPVQVTGHSLTARETDILLVWATGGTPEGNPEHRPGSNPPVPNEWPLGPPDRVVPIPAEYIMPADNQDDVEEFVVATGLPEPRWLRAIDLKPTTPALVRSATILLTSSDGHDTVISQWQPGETPWAGPDDAAFKLPADANLKVRIRYKRPWQAAATSKLTDRSAVGLYFAQKPAGLHEFQSVDLAAAASQDQASRRLQSPISRPLRVMAVRFALDQAYDRISVRGLLPNGTAVPLLQLSNPRPEWDRRYWLEQPIQLPPGASLEAIAIVAPPEPDSVTRPPTTPTALGVSVDFVSP